LARRVDSTGVSWGMMQSTVALVMAYPALARRALPLLARALDAAA